MGIRCNFESNILEIIFKRAMIYLVDVLSDKLCGSKFYVPRKPHILYIIRKI